MHKITPDSILYEVLKMLSGSGEISPKIFHYGQTRYDTYNWQIRQMEKAADYITPDGTRFNHLKFVNRSGGRKTNIPKTIRLSKEVFDSHILDHAGLAPDILEKVTTFNRSSVIRNQNMAQIKFLLSLCGIKSYKREKPALSNHQSVTIQEPSFYTLKEMKQVGGKIDVQTAQGRSYGAVLNQDKAVTIFNLAGAWNKVSYESEQRSRIMMDFCVRKNVPAKWYLRRETKYFGNAAILSPDMNFAMHLLDGKQQDHNHININDNNYQHYHFVPLNEYCLDVLPFVVLPWPKDKIVHTILGANLQDEKHTVDCDFQNKNRYFLMTFDFDLNRIRNFLYSASQLKKGNFLMIVFNWQKPLLQQYVSSYYGMNNVFIQSINAEDILELLPLFHDD